MQQETKIIMEKEIKITPPEGFEIDKERSTFDCIRFKPIEKKKWRDNTDAIVKGYYIDYGGCINEQHNGRNRKENYGLFATEKQAKSALAMARISQIMANDERFGGVVTDKEWCNGNMKKYVIIKNGECIIKTYYYTFYSFLAFRNAAIRDLFFEENEDLIKDYLMSD